MENTPINTPITPEVPQTEEPQKQQEEIEINFEEIRGISEKYNTLLMENKKLCDKINILEEKVNSIKIPKFTVVGKPQPEITPTQMQDKLIKEFFKI